MSNAPEVWLRGPLKDIPALLQPIAHALLQAREEVNGTMKGFPDELLWEQTAGLASPGFHLQHLRGVLNRLFTYASGRKLDESQLEALSKEGMRTRGALSTAELVKLFDAEVNYALAQLVVVNEFTLTEKRSVGRAGLPSTVIGLYVHAAEHTMRHVGQLLVTVKILLSK